jgi:hypothetical protein
MGLKLMIPYMGQVDAADSRLKDLAEFLGIQCELVSLDPNGRHFAEFLERAVPDRHACLVVNPGVLQRWVGGKSVPTELVSCLVSRFSHLLVHGLRVEPFDANMIAALSQECLQTIQANGGTGGSYEVAKNTNDVCDAFSGLEFGPTNPVNDHVFGVTAGAPGVRRLISIGGRPFMSSLKRERTEILFLASEDVVDLDSPAGDSPLSEYFSRLVPQVMALRSIFGEQCWRPREQHACVIIDDPLLQRKYGFLDFEHLFQLVERYNFHTSIAFIPHNYRRNSSRIVEQFRNNPERLSICFHGSDHTEAELASSDTTLLSTILRVAEFRMKQHEVNAGLVCDKVMVFPQGYFSPEAMKVLKMRDFLAAVNTGPYPVGQSSSLTIREFIQPAILRYEGFPLFLRRYLKEIQSQDIAFNLFFGKPVLLVEHHEIFEHPELLIGAVQKVNFLAPGIHWTGLEGAVSNSILSRRRPDGTSQVRAYSSKVRISNGSNQIQRYSVQWDGEDVAESVERVLENGMPCTRAEAKECGICVPLDLPPSSSSTVSLIHRNPGLGRDSLGLRWSAKAFIRRRLSELRDNHLSQSPRLLNVARTLRDRYLS